MNGNVQVAVLIALAGGVTASAAALLLKYRTNPEKRERERRLWVAKKGRFGEGFITDVEEGLIHYSYSVRGVQYTASQDVRPLLELLPEDLQVLIGPVTIKYSTRNPGNSILVAEEWSGLRWQRRSD